jgi:5-methylcytosine-specific restriction endonuclease McrA
MADKHPTLLHCQVEIAAACGVPGRTIVLALGVSRFTQNRWLKSDGRERQKTYRNRWNKKNPDSRARSHKKWRESHLEQERAKSRIRNRESYKKNPEYYIAKSNNRQRNFRKIPLTLDERRRIQALIGQARLLSKQTGVPHEVDHIWPISRGGWHHPSNMRVITKEENRRKGSKLPTLEEMLRNTTNKDT